MIEFGMLVEVLFRWVHVGTAIVLLGGLVFLRFLLLPAAAALPEAEHDALRDRVMGRWRRYVMIGILLLLVSGFYNYLVFARERHAGLPLYHMLVGIKILLAFAVFFLGSALAGRARVFESLRRNSRKWMGLTIALAAIIVAISGLVKVVPMEPRAAQEQVVTP